VMEDESKIDPRFFASLGMTTTRCLAGNLEASSVFDLFVAYLHTRIAPHIITKFPA